MTAKKGPEAIPRASLFCRGRKAGRNRRFFLGGIASGDNGAQTSSAYKQRPDGRLNQINNLLHAWERRESPHRLMLLPHGPRDIRKLPRRHDQGFKALRKLRVLRATPHGGGNGKHP